MAAYTHPFNGPFLGLPRWAGTRKVKPIWILLKQETVSGSGISCAICKSASRSRQITIPVPHHSSFFTGRMPFLPPNQQCQSTEGKSTNGSLLLGLWLMSPAGWLPRTGISSGTRTLGNPVWTTFTFFYLYVVNCFTDDLSARTNGSKLCECIASV